MSLAWALLAPGLVLADRCEAEVAQAADLLTEASQQLSRGYVKGALALVERAEIAVGKCGPMAEIHCSRAGVLGRLGQDNESVQQYRVCASLAERDSRLDPRDAAAIAQRARREARAKERPGGWTLDGPVAVVAHRDRAECRRPRWSPDGRQLAYETRSPDGRHETWIASFAPAGDAPTDDTRPLPRQESERLVTMGRVVEGLVVSRLASPVIDLAWAPDMRLLNDPFVFSGRGSGQGFDLFADGGWIVESPGDDREPAWSPDGRYLAYSAGSGAIELLDLSGGAAPRRVGGNRAVYQDPQWAPVAPEGLDPGAAPTRPRPGEVISGARQALVVVGYDADPTGHDLVLLEDVGRPEQAWRPVTTWRGDEIRPSWSPDGRRIAFYANRDRPDPRDFDLWVVEVADLSATMLARDVHADDAEAPQWLPDGESVLYVRQDARGDLRIHWVRLDGTDGGPLPTGTVQSTAPALVRVGEEAFIAFVARGQNEWPALLRARLTKVVDESPGPRAADEDLASLLASAGGPPAPRPPREPRVPCDAALRGELDAIALVFERARDIPPPDLDLLLGVPTGVECRGEALRLAGSYFLERRDHVHACETLRDAVEVWPNRRSPTVLRSAAWACAQAQRLDVALTFFRRVYENLHDLRGDARVQVYAEHAEMLKFEFVRQLHDDPKKADVRLLREALLRWDRFIHLSRGVDPASVERGERQRDDVVRMLDATDP